MPQPKSDPAQSGAITSGGRLLESWELSVLSQGCARDPAALATAHCKWLPATAPGTAMAALFAAGEADFKRLPLLDAQDVWYRCRFSVSAPEAGTRTALVFEGLATLAEVWLNGIRILESVNMFLAHEVDVDASLAIENELLIRFASINESLKARRPRPRWRTRLVEQQQLRWIRSSLLGADSRLDTGNTRDRPLATHPARDASPDRMP